MLSFIIAQGQYVLTHVCTSYYYDTFISASVNRINIGSDNALSPIWHHVIIKTNDGVLSIGPLGIHFSEIWKHRLWNGGHFVQGEMS